MSVGTKRVEAVIEAPKGTRSGGSPGLDMKMKANTVKTRTRSLLNQGFFYFDCLLNMHGERARPQLQRFDALLLRQHAATRESGSASYEGMPQGPPDYTPEVGR